MHQDLVEQWRAALLTSYGDSNDEEIDAWRGLAEVALDRLGVPRPEVEWPGG